MRREIKAYVEAELRDYYTTKNDFENVRIDIIESTPIVQERGGNLPGDQTASKGLRLITNRRLRYMENVLGAIENVLSELDETDIELVKLKYWQRPRQLTDAGIGVKLGMSKATVWRRADRICNSIARELGLVDEVQARVKKKSV